MNKTMKLALSIALLCGLNTAHAKTQPLQDCSQLQAPNTVLLVHASWCHYCQLFKPTYEAVSDLPEMKEYTFYTKQNDDFNPVCGKIIDGVPMTFTHSMSKVLDGSVAAEELVKFVKDQ